MPLIPGNFYRAGLEGKIALKDSKTDGQKFSDAPKSILNIQWK